jgi:hypothetical protein
MPKIIGIAELFNEATGLPGAAVDWAFTGTAADSAALTAGKTYLLQASEDCHVEFGAAPTATTASTPIFAGRQYIVRIPTDSVTYICSAIRTAVSGTAFLTPLTGDRVA